MTKKIFTLIGICYCLISYSQTNTFPSTGAVGIGTTSPFIGKLQIEQTDNNTFFGMTGSGNSRFFLGTDAAGNVYMRTGNNVDMRFGVNGNDHMTLKNGGNFGIGTTSPTQKLEVNGTTVITGSGLSNNTVNGIYINRDGIYSLNGGMGYDLTIQAKVMTFYSGSVYGEKMRLESSGNLGIGVTAPSSLLHVSLPSGRNGKIITLGRSANAYNYHIGISSDSRFIIYDNDTTQERLFITSAGNVGIGSIIASEKLTVSGNAKINGNVTAKKVTVTQLGWSDYVFYDNYHLRSLPELEKFIYTNKHLPDVPSAKDVKENGINVGDNQAMLLKKIEELTLYIIRIDKEKQVLQHRLEDVERKVKRQ